MKEVFGFHCPQAILFVVTEYSILHLLVAGRVSIALRQFSSL